MKPAIIIILYNVMLSPPARGGRGLKLDIGIIIFKLF